MRLIKSNLIIFALVFIWIIFIGSYLRGVNYFSLSLEQPIPGQSLGDYRGDPLLQEHVVEFDYPSNHPYLSSVIVNFNTFYKKNTDTLRFSIKEVGQKGWYYQGDYGTGQIQQFQKYYFKFPTIAESSGKIYQIKIESLGGAEGDYVAIASPLENSVKVEHAFSKERLSEDIGQILYLAFHKATFLVSDPLFIRHLTLYSLPLIYFLIYSLVGSSMGVFSVIIFLSILLNSLLLRGFSAFFMLSVMFGWSLMILHHRVESKVSVSVSLSAFLLSIIFYLLGVSVVGDKLAAWTYMFLLFTVVQLFYETKLRPKKLLSLHRYWHDLVAEGRTMAALTYQIIVGEVNISVERGKYNLGTKDGAILGSDKSPELVTLVVYRWQAPMVRTYIYTSRFLAYMTVMVVKVISKILSHGPFIIFGWLLWVLFRQTREQINFFYAFFPDRQMDYFWDQVGNNLLKIYLFVLLIFFVLLLIKKLDLRRKVLILTVMFYFCTIISHSLFTNATPYRNDLKIWSVSPGETAEPWVDVAIRGRNFREMPFAGTVWIDGVEQRVVVWGDREIIFRTDPFTTRSGNLTVKGYKKTISNSVFFIYSGNR
ncbi:hypothetical protein A3K29_03065 [Candidatus Collierbacteria bacterium RIFOXYB2_FULL_46_14]|uniref:IPT/TIG domain-containing protein n=1 Tax=Candidatus Collierbacteria bacterium GW2011_GWA2_46_26 TaxID=1618381 RepID=A0A0G1SKK2_9BACT|nr:MAG: hypothetical protein UW29_C0004G0119 [Candidatus Collierbacteria bacterium GW2011_GWC2_44_13]KKU33830.1 MAG: hypothetical protein UX47_C0001G0113 [Candidatus Collierbacteria bacterium GW2011_GWA2_46_26]OGD73101.1 MAG: hypothetical protein A3K29_03065 [Candidatus Collierbacteria bacterium RIFOXYB2_FULL_46_14]OGD76143.1 MAG: hypothetical protein A3K43_03065 [Candidatus Collierbacteria bacterium RIFOXYA2_FULL_46_20]OGD77479.1 MAG: hypothetical protein A3K39_03065 [Candidatus Collierbacteri